ncbi:hypothetical protein D515_01810 [Grimontia indica]|uniref:Uncharacterized protein n=1 Tax=Grimontia indica TaxID=1056512 RepID=R1IPH1_9GAMM|nr:MULTISPECIES: hypothetical protein [Grimontia]EOD79357.1 hypothetical protein D515_01810 [Grimontia indica]
MIKHTESLSRDHFYIAIDEGEQTFTHKFQVGGEHINHYYIFGVMGERFAITVEEWEGRVDVYVDGEGIRHELDEYYVDKRYTWLEVAVSAHPYANYNLKVRRHGK